MTVSGRARSPFGIVGYRVYVPPHRLRRSEVAAALGKSAHGQRAVSGYDEDTTTMAVEAAGDLVRQSGAAPSRLWFATTDPAYADKSNAVTVHAALGLSSEVQAVDVGPSLRSGAAALMAAARDGGLALLSDRRNGPAGGADERDGGDAAAAVLFGDETALAEVTHMASVTADLLDRWRAPDSSGGATWEERFGEQRYLELADTVMADLAEQGLSLSTIDRSAVVCANIRAARAVSKQLQAQTGRPAISADLLELIGFTGTAQIGLTLADFLDNAESGQTLLLMSLADGADAMVVRAGPDIAERRGPAFREELEQTLAVGYAQYLLWRGRVQGEHPRRPDPSRISAPFAWRNRAFKLSLAGGRCRACGAIQYPLPSVCYRCHRANDFERVDAAGQRGRIVTFTIDRLAFSPAPPLVSAIVALEQGGRIQFEMTDVTNIDVGDIVIPTFRVGSTTDGIHNYIWKVRPVSTGSATGGKV